MLAPAEQANARAHQLYPYLEPPQAPENAIYNEAYALSYLYDVPIEFVPELAILIQSGVLGKKASAEKWDNIGEHCILAGKMALPIAWLIGLPADSALQVTQQAYIHDAHLRQEKEKKGKSDMVINGMQRVYVDNQFYYEHEMAHPGILHATSMDWRDYQDWPTELQIMRYVDSCVGPEILPDGTCGRDAIQHYSKRTFHLHQRKEPISREIGNKWYGGIPAFKHLHTVTADIEKTLHTSAMQAHPEIMCNYADPSHFFNVVYDHVHYPAVNWSEYVGYDTLSS